MTEKYSHKSPQPRKVRVVQTPVLKVEFPRVVAKSKTIYVVRQVWQSGGRREAVLVVSTDKVPKPDPLTFGFLESDYRGKDAIEGALAKTIRDFRYRLELGEKMGRTRHRGILDRLRRKPCPRELGGGKVKKLKAKPEVFDVELDPLSDLASRLAQKPRSNLSARLIHENGFGGQADA